MCKVTLEAMNFMEMQACVRWNEGGPNFNEIPYSPY